MTIWRCELWDGDGNIGVVWMPKPNVGELIWFRTETSEGYSIEQLCHVHDRSEPGASQLGAHMFLRLEVRRLAKR